jgi:hypothetical protein
VIEVATVVERRIEQEWRSHLGPRETDELTATLLRLREITDPFA